MITHHQKSGQAMLSDAKLLTQLQAGDETSFEVLFRRHYDRIYTILYRLLGNQADAEDVAQQVFLKLYHSPDRLRVQGDEANVAGWLYRVAVNTGYNTLRSRKQQQQWQEKWDRWWPFNASPPDPAALAESSDREGRVRHVLAQIKPRDAKLLLLRYSGLSYKELAAALDLAPGSIGSLLSRAERAFVQKYRLVYPEKE